MPDERGSVKRKYINKTGIAFQLVGQFRGSICYLKRMGVFPLEGIERMRLVLVGLGVLVDKLSDSKEVHLRGNDVPVAMFVPHRLQVLPIQTQHGVAAVNCMPSLQKVLKGL